MRLRLHDPGRASLRKAARTAVVMPPLFAFCLVVVDDLQMALLASFGSFSLLAFANFGGPPFRRTRAYVALTAVGLLFVTIATLLSGNAWLAALGTAVVAFVVTFAGVLGGYFAASQVAAILVFVLSVAVPADADDIPSRLAGWALAGAASTLAALVLWPHRERNPLRPRLAATASAVADVLEAWAAPDPVLLTTRRAAAAAASEAIAETFYREPDPPVGPTVQEQAIVYLTGSLRRAQEFTNRLRPLDTGRTGPDVDLALATAGAFRQLAAFLETKGGTIDLDALELARKRHADSVEAAVERSSSSALTDAIRRAFDLRIVSFAVLTAGANAMLAAGGRPREVDGDVPPLVPAEGIGPTTRRLDALVRSNLQPSSVWFQAGVRAGLGLGIAVLVATLADLQHAFWVVLGTLTVLKSSAVTTSFTAWQALLGTLVGFGLATAFLEAGGDARPALWAALPICVFLAVYTPTAIHAVVGQAMFTVTVVVLFNLIQPQGWRTGLTRLEDILIGAATSLVVGFALWPRGARGQLRARLGTLFEAGATYVREAFENAVGRAGESEIVAARSQVRDQIWRATEAFSTYLNERGPKRVPHEAWLGLLTAGHYLRFAGDAVVARTRALGPAEGTPASTGALEAAATDLEQRLVGIGRAVERPAGLPAVAVPPRQDSVLDRVLAGANSPTAPEAPLGLVWAAAWIEDAQSVLDGLEEPLEQVTTVGARPWWA